VVEMATDFDITAMRLDDADVRAENFIIANLDQWAQKHIYQPLIALMISSSVPDHVTKNVKYTRTGPLEFEIEWDLFTEEGAPLSIFLEKGWKEHEIWSHYPNGPLLHWTSKLGGGAITQHHFANKVTNPGFVGYHFFEQIAQTQTPHLAADIGQLLEQHLQDVSIT